MTRNSHSYIPTKLEELRKTNGERSCDCTSCECGNSGNTYSVGSWDGADWVLNELAKALAEQPAGPAQLSEPEVRLCEDGSLDEVCADMAHLEKLDHNHWFLDVQQGNRSVSVWLHGKGVVRATWERRDVPSRQAATAQPEGTKSV